MTTKPSDRNTEAPFKLVPFAARLPEWLTAGVTPPTNSDGNVLNFRMMEPKLETMLTSLDGARWNLRWIWQVHGNTVIRASESAQGERADGIVTDERGVMLCTRHADCPPILIWHGGSRSVGLAHSGRKGTFANIAQALVDAMRGEFGADPSDLEAAIGPGIRDCCYEIREDVFADEQQELYARPFVAHREDAMFLDLYRMIGSQLERAGVGRVYGVETAECTYCGPSRLHSYRRGHDGRNFAALAGISP